MSDTTIELRVSTGRDLTADTLDQRVPTTSSRIGWMRRWHTLRYFQPGQIARRIASRVRGACTQRFVVERFAADSGAAPAFALGPEFRTIAHRKLSQRRRRADLQHRVAAIRHGQMTFLGRMIDLGRPIDWRSANLTDVPRLWRFQLEYQEWLLDLAAAAKAAAPSDATGAVWEEINNWIDTWSGATEGAAGDAWHPFCISRRLPVWLSLWAWQPPPEHRWDVIARSLFAQAAFLSRRLETDLGGNHLLENARALALAGVVFAGEESRRWLNLAQQIVMCECREQVLPEGEHFERSPMYHCQMIDVLADIRDATAEHARPLSDFCRQTVERMEQFAMSVLHPDGQIPLLGDSVFDEAPLPEPKSVVTETRIADHDPGAQQVGDYWSYKNGRDFLLFDAGPVGPDHLPAHAHSDLLTLETSIGGRRLLVDSGTFDYEASPMRDYCRSTAAHNVLEIDGQNQCDVWSRFRMGRRGWPTPLRMGQAGSFFWSSATHNAYRHLGVPVVGRWIACRPEFPWLLIDWALGKGVHTLVNRLHVHPDAVVGAISPTSVKVELEERPLYVTALGPGQMRIAEGWYCPEFGRRFGNRVIEWHWTGDLSAAVGWMLSTEPPRSAPLLRLQRDTICLDGCDLTGNQTFTITTSPQSF